MQHASNKTVRRTTLASMECKHRNRRACSFGMPARRNVAKSHRRSGGAPVNRIASSHRTHSCSIDARAKERLVQERTNAAPWHNRRNSFVLVAFPLFDMLNRSACTTIRVCENNNIIHISLIANIHTLRVQTIENVVKVGIDIGRVEFGIEHCACARHLDARTSHSSMHRSMHTRAVRYRYRTKIDKAATNARTAASLRDDATINSFSRVIIFSFVEQTENMLSDYRSCFQQCVNDVSCKRIARQHCNTTKTQKSTANVEQRRQCVSGPSRRRPTPAPLPHRHIALA